MMKGTKRLCYPIELAVPSGRVWTIRGRREAAHTTPGGRRSRVSVDVRTRTKALDGRTGARRRVASARATARSGGASSSLVVVARTAQGWLREAVAPSVATHRTAPHRAAGAKPRTCVRSCVPEPCWSYTLSSKNFRLWRVIILLKKNSWVS